AQRPLRPAFPRAAAVPARKPQAGGAAPVYGGARPPSARRPREAREPLLPVRLLRGVDRALLPGVTRRGGDRRGPRPPDRAGAGARSPPRLRAPHARRSPQAARTRQAPA